MLSERGGRGNIPKTKIGEMGEPLGLPYGRFLQAFFAGSLGVSKAGTFFSISVQGKILSYTVCKEATYLQVYHCFLCA